MGTRNATVIAVCNYKGGTAKTTTAAFLAEHFHRQGKRVVLVDAETDVQQSATMLARNAEVEWEVQRMHKPALSSKVHALRNQYDVIIVDAPGADGPYKVVEGAIHSADFVLIPVTASPLEVKQLPETVDVCDAFNIPYAILFNREPVNSQATKNAMAQVREAGWEVITPAIPKRAAIRDVYMNGFNHEQYGYDLIADQVMERI